MTAISKSQVAAHVVSQEELRALLNQLLGPRSGAYKEESIELDGRKGSYLVVGATGNRRYWPNHTPENLARLFASMRNEGDLLYPKAERDYTAKGFEVRKVPGLHAAIVLPAWVPTSPNGHFATNMQPGE